MLILCTFGLVGHYTDVRQCRRSTVLRQRLCQHVREKSQRNLCEFHGLFALLQACMISLELVGVLRILTCSDGGLPALALPHVQDL